MSTTWNDKTVKPTTEQCESNENKFIAWDGRRRYITYFDMYDGIFRIPIDRGGVIKREPDTAMMKWTTFPDPPKE